MAITFYTIDVGHGLCQIIRFGNRRAILIDGGGNLGKPIAAEFLKRYVDVIVAFVATHNDADHVGAAPSLLDNYPTAKLLQHVWLLFDRPARKPHHLDENIIPLLGYVKRRDEAGTIEGAHSLYVDDTNAPRPRHKVIHRELAENAELQLLYPRQMDVTDAFLRGRPDPKATNKSSAILRFVVGDPNSKASALITGDASCSAFQVAHEKYRFDLRARVLSIPHHGGEIPNAGDPGSWKQIVDWVSPDIAVVSAGFGTVPASTTTKRAAFEPLLHLGANTCCTQITKHCHTAFNTLHPSVLDSRNRGYPQMSGHKNFPDAVGCMGTIAIKIDAVGDATLVNRASHYDGVTTKVVPSGSPHCRQ